MVDLAENVPDVLADLSNIPGVTTSPKTERKQDIKDILREVFPDGDIMSKSVLNQEQVIAVAIAWTFAKKQGNETLKEMIRTLLKLQISFGGWGRRDMRLIMQSVLQQDQQAEETSLQKLRRKIFG